MAFIFFSIIAAIAIVAWFGTRRGSENDKSASARTAATVAGVVAVACIALAVTQSLTVVPAGNVGVVDFFGTVSDKTLKAGINFINPLAKVVKFSVKTQEIKEVMDVPSKEGLTVQLELSALFHLNPDKAAEVYKTIGEGYLETILIPNFRSVTRGVTAEYEAKALYTSERETLTKAILAELEKLTEPRGITVESTPLRKVGLPADLSQAIEEKLRAEQESQRMQFVLQKESQEAQRKRIEAQGISDFQNIVARGIHRWEG